MTRFHKAFLVVSAFTLSTLGSLAVVMYIAHDYAPANGERAFAFAFDGSSPWMSPFSPGTRVTTAGLQDDGWVGQRVLQDPVYASVRLPGEYERVQVSMDIRPHGNALAELGLRQSESAGFDMRPLWSAPLQHGWEEKTLSDGSSGYARVGDTFDVATLSADSVLLWQASSTPLTLADREAQPRSFEVALRGAHEFSLVPVDGTVEMTFTLQDMNRRRDRGTIVLSLSRDGELLASEAFSLAGSQDTRPSIPFERTFLRSGLEPGVYKLTLQSDDDIFVRRIASPNRHWVIGSRLVSGDQVGYATSTLATRVWTNARHVRAQTFHQEGLGEIQFGATTGVLRETHQEYALDRAPSDTAHVVELSAPHGDVRLIGDGYYALAPELFFAPSARKLSESSDLDAEGIRLVKTSYTHPVDVGDGWYRVSATYDLQVPSGYVTLALAVPGSNEDREGFDIRAGELVFERSVSDRRQRLYDGLRDIYRGVRRWFSIL